MAHADLDRLCGYCVKFARRMLQERGEVAPFAAAIRRGGALVPVVLDSEEADANAIAQQLTTGLQMLAKQQQVNAVALCFDGLVSPEAEPRRKRSAIVVGLEHVNGESLNVFVTYRKRTLLGYSFDHWKALPRTRSFFPEDTTPA